MVALGMAIVTNAMTVTSTHSPPHSELSGLVGNGASQDTSRVTQNLVPETNEFKLRLYHN